MGCPGSPAGHAHVGGVERAAVEAQEVQQQHAQVGLQRGGFSAAAAAAAARGVRQQERGDHYQQRVGADAAVVHLCHAGKRV